MITIRDLAPVNAYNVENEKALGTAGVIVKAGQGHAVYNYKPIVADYVRGGIPPGVYWLSDARYSPEGHKRAIKNTFPTGDFGPLGIWIDVEKPLLRMTDAEYRTLPYRYAGPIISFARGIIDYSGVIPGIYTSPGAYDLILSGANEEDKRFLSTLPLWTAQYNAHITEPDLYGYWTTWRYWQFREGPDYSKFNGTPEEYYRLIGGSIPAGDRFRQTINFTDGTMIPMKEG